MVYLYDDKIYHNITKLESYVWECASFISDSVGAIETKYEELLEDIEELSNDVLYDWYKNSYLAANDEIEEVLQLGLIEDFYIKVLALYIIVNQYGEVL